MKEFGFEIEIPAGLIVIAVAATIILILICCRIQSTADRADYKITVHEGCEYFQCPVATGIIISHKGNCTNSIHRWNQ